MTQRLTKTEVAAHLNIEVDAVDNLVERGQLAAPVDHAGPWSSPRWDADDVAQVTSVEVVKAEDTNLILNVYPDGSTTCGVAGEELSIVPCAVWEYVVERVLSPEEKMSISPEYHRQAALQRLYEAAPTHIPVPLSVLASGNAS